MGLVHASTTVLGSAVLGAEDCSQPPPASRSRLACTHPLSVASVVLALLWLATHSTQAYTLAQHVCFEQSWLLYGRHLDQALLCCLYSVCKVRARLALLCSKHAAMWSRCVVMPCCGHAVLPMSCCGRAVLPMGGRLLPATSRCPVKSGEAAATHACVRPHSLPLHSLPAPSQMHHLGQASFKSIISAYKQQPQARPDTFKSGELAGLYWALPVGA